jgi:alpha-methylacyl-CoA racemase
MAVAGVLMALLNKGANPAVRGPHIIDVSMTHSVAYYSSLLSQLCGASFEKQQQSSPSEEAAAPLAATVAPFLQPGEVPWYDTYCTADQRFVAVGAVEPLFFASLLMGLDKIQSPSEAALKDKLIPLVTATPGPETMRLVARFQNDRAVWPSLRRYFEVVFASRPQKFWEQHFGPGERNPYRDACVTPVLSQKEALASFGSSVPPPSPRIEVAGQALGGGSERLPLDGIVRPGKHTTEVLKDLGISEERIRGLLQEGIAVQT